MLVGIGFLAVVTGAIAERFISTDQETIAASEDRIQKAMESTHVKLDEITARLETLETSLHQMAKRDSAGKR
jgi:prefoldin subunit 5